MKNVRAKVHTVVAAPFTLRMTSVECDEWNGVDCLNFQTTSVAIAVAWMVVRLTATYSSDWKSFAAETIDISVVALCHLNTPAFVQ